MATNEKSTSQAASRKALGRGLDALLSNRSGASAAAAASPAVESGEHVRMIRLDAIDPNPDQPRTVFQPGAIEELSQSIKEDGVLLPRLAVRMGEEAFACSVPARSRLQLIRSSTSCSGACAFALCK